MSEKSVKKESLEWLKSFGIALIIVIIIRTFLFSNYVVEGDSMLPTLQDGDRLIVNKVGYKIGDINRFDIIVFHANKDEDYVKRVIGLPGDTIEYNEDVLYINGEKVAESFLQEVKQNGIGSNYTGDFTLETTTDEHIVPEGQVFVLGDNRLGSWDSRHFGFVDIDSIVGKVNLRYWPFSEAKIDFSQ